MQKKERRSPHTRAMPHITASHLYTRRPRCSTCSVYYIFILARERTRNILIRFLLTLARSRSRSCTRRQERTNTNTRRSDTHTHGHARTRVFVARRRASFARARHARPTRVPRRMNANDKIQTNCLPDDAGVRVYTYALICLCASE